MDTAAAVDQPNEYCASMLELLMADSRLAARGVASSTLS